MYEPHGYGRQASAYDGIAGCTGLAANDIENHRLERNRGTVLGFHDPQLQKANDSGTLCTNRWISEA